MAKTKTTKILVSLWDTLHDALARRIDAACLRRDAFLQRVIAAELPYLDSEIPVPNSEAAKKSISKHLALLKRKPLTLNLERDTVKRLDDICERKNLVRDAFINRLVLCLLAQPKLLGILFDAEEIPDDVKFSWEEPGVGHRWQVLRTIPDYIDDPFGYLRTHLSLQKEATGDSAFAFYRMYVPANLFSSGRKGEAGEEEVTNTFGLNVYLPDELVPGHPAAEKRMKLLFEDFEVPGQEKKS